MAEGIFTVIDYVIFAVVIAVSLGIGVYAAFSGGRQRTTNEYFVANRSMKVFPVFLSLLVSYESSILMLGVPGEIYVYGFQYIWNTVALTASSIAIAVYLVPIFHDNNIVSAYEYLEKRFESRSVRLLGSFFGIMLNIMYMGIALYGPATALEAVSGFSFWYSILIVSSAAIVYTSIGGIKAVIWSDVFQFAIMVVGMVTVLIMGTILVGGPGELHRLSERGGRFNIFTFNPDPTIRMSFWNLVIGRTIQLLALGTNQTSVQRIATLPTKHKARAIFLGLAPGMVAFSVLACMEGLIVYAFYAKVGCDPLQAGYISNPNQILPYFIVDQFSSLPGISGLFIASLFSATLSTLSSGYASMASIVWTDFFKPVYPNISEFRATVIAKCSVVIFGILSICIAIVVMFAGKVVIEMYVTLTSSFAAPLLGLFLLGSLFPWANAKGAFTGCTVAAMICLWKSLGSLYGQTLQHSDMLPLTTDNCTVSNVTSSLLVSATNVTMATSTTVAPELEGFYYGLAYFYSISFMWLGAMGVTITLVTGIVVSFATGARDPASVDRKLLIPIDRLICCCLPTRIADKLRYGKITPCEKVFDNGDESMTMTSIQNGQAGIAQSLLSKKQTS